MIMIMMTINMLFIFMNHPMSMGLILIIQTIMVSITSGMMVKMFWMSYILVITMLSGMLVLFIYMSSMASNEKFKNKIKLWIMFMIMVTLNILFLFLIKKMIIKNNYFSMGMKLFKMSETMNWMKLFNLENTIITLMMVIYLLLTMIVSTHLVNISEGPMRLKI